MVDKIKKLIRDGESETVEFKLATKNLPHNLFESICAFLNRFGGIIILGVDDNRKIVGVLKEQIEALKKDFVNLCNNPQKMYPTVYLAIRDIKIGNKYLLYIRVPESSEVH